MDEASVPALPRGVRVHDDRVRGVKVLLAPERVLTLDQIGEAILSQVDGERSFGQIVSLLAARYDAPVDQIAKDAGAFLGTLRDRRFLDVTP